MYMYLALHVEKNSNFTIEYIYLYQVYTCLNCKIMIGTSQTQ